MFFSKKEKSLFLNMRRMPKMDVNNKLRFINKLPAITQSGIINKSPNIVLSILGFFKLICIAKEIIN